MSNIVNESINAYIEKQYQEDDPVLLEMENYGKERNFPLVGPQVGRLLFILTRVLMAKSVFEMGSGYGYSAYWFAKALPQRGKVYQTENLQKNSKKAREFFEKGGLEEKAEFLVGDALELIDRVPGDFDIIFLELQKEDYTTAFSKAKKRLVPGGLLIADNPLWFGRVLETSQDPETLGIQKFTQLLFTDPGFNATILPIRDGVAIGYKKP